MKTTLLCMLLLLILAAAPTLADDRFLEPPELSYTTPVATAAAPVAETGTKYWNHELSVSIFSQYIWRGIRQRAKDAAVLQGNWSASHNRWTYSIWGSMELTGRNDNTFFPGDKQQYKITEGDYTADYAWTLGKYGLNTGLIYYRFPNSNFLSTQELYQSITFPGRLAPTLTIYQDIDECRGMYGVLSLSHSWKNWTLDGQVSYGSKKYNNFWFGVNQAAAAHASLQLSYNHQLNRIWTLTPTIAWTGIIDRNLKNSGVLSGHPNNIWGGVTFSRSF